MKVTIEGKAHFKAEVACPKSDGEERPITLVGSPDEDLEPGMVLLCHEDVSLEVSVSDLQRALRVFERK